MRARISIVIPVLNEAAAVADSLGALAALRSQGHEVIVVDGHSEDGTVEQARGCADAVISAPRGRASQMNAGASAARGDILVFLHADTRLPQGAAELVLDALDRHGREWGRFDVRIGGDRPLLAVVACMMNLRSRCTGIATGDQAIFVRRSSFSGAGGFPDMALMEDIALSIRLRRRSRPVCLRAKVVTSGRRWEKNGVARTILLMWWLRLRFFLGASPDALARRYHRPPT